MIINSKKHRFTFFFIVLCLVVSVFIFRLAQLQIVQGEHYQELAKNKMVRKITETAPRGSIFTSDGVEIAKNVIGYTVELAYNNSDRVEQNKVLLTLYKILEKNQEKFDDTFPIIIEDNEFYFTYEKEETAWKAGQQISASATAQEALNILRDRYNVKEEVSNEVALKAIEKVHIGSSLPISMEDGELVFSYKKTETAWKKGNGFKEEEYGLTAKESFDKLKKKYEIDTNTLDIDARKILVFQEMVRSKGYRSWEPIEISKNVSLNTVFELDSNIHELTGVSVVAKPVRQYPFDNLASHILGYIGKVSEKDVENGKYKMNDLKGISGIESAYEDELKGEDGERFAVTDYKGRPQNDPTKEVVEPVSGNDLLLTINYALQNAAEEAVEKQISAIQQKAPNAQSGAAVVLNAKTSAVLALVSFPDYNPNLFTNGISTEDWKNLNILVNDPLYPKPLYNNATMTALQPGSSFKPLMAAAGLQEGAITMKSTIFCRGVHPIYTQFTCLGYHGSETVREAIKDSCNVFFYEVGNRLGVDNIEKYAREFGLGSKTGLEISESSGYLATKADKVKIWTYSTSDYIRKTVGIEGTAEIINDDGKPQEVYKSYAIAKELFTEITSDKYSTYGAVFKEVSNIMSKYNIKESNHLHKITQYVFAGRWVGSDTINASIGQGGNSFTPIQVANYLATLVNGGVNRQTYLVDKILDSEGKVTYEHQEKIQNKLSIDPQYIEEIKKGMKDVMMYSTGRRAYMGFDHTNIGVGGKTGTAQYGSDKVDNTAWFMGFAPYDDPEIVVVAMIIQGKTSGNAVPIGRAIMDAYFAQDANSQNTENAQVDSGEENIQD